MKQNFSTIIDLLVHNNRTQPDKGALYYKVDGSYIPLTYSKLYEMVISFALGLMHFGVNKGERVCILSTNRPEWVISDLGTLMIGAISVPIYPTLTSSEIAHILNDSGAKIVVVEKEEHLDKVCSVIDKCAALRHIICLEKAQNNTESRVLSFSDVKDVGQKAKPNQREKLISAALELDQEMIASIVYTSGTTGVPKGVVLSHKNFITNVNDILSVLHLKHDEVALSFLPLSHVFERTAGYYTLLAIGGSIYYAENIQTIAQDMLLVKPTALISVPRIYEKIQANIYLNLSGFKEVLFKWAIAVGKQYRQALNTDLGIPVLLRIQHRLADKLIFSKVRAKTGGNVRFFVSGGAPLGKDLGEFFDAIGMQIIEGYGLTETSPVVACNRPNHNRFGSVGLPLPSVDVRLGKNDELQVKGDSVSIGYWQLAEETKESFIDDGWFCTGDVARISDNGFIYIIDRIKELIVLSNGKKVAPQAVERQILTSRYISQVIVTGENRSYLTALVVPDLDQIKSLAVSKSWDGKNVEAFLNQSEVIAAFDEIIKEKLQDFARFEQVKTCRLLAHELSEAGGELTPSLKPKRKFIREKYNEQITNMYETKQV